MDCYEIYNADLEFCPKVNCYGRVVEIDELMLPTIMLLNQKGYITDFCCSGHSYEEGCYPYIAFDNDFSEYFADELNKLFKDISQPWFIETNNNDTIYHRFTIRCKIKSANMIEQYKEIINVNLKLLDFVKSLPELEY